MVEQVIVLGAHSYFGFSLCEKLVEEGVEVKAFFDDSVKGNVRNILDERLMLIGRNANFDVNLFFRELVEEEEADLIVYCHEDPDDVEILRQSIDIAKKRNIDFLFIQSSDEKVPLCNELKEYTVFQFPRLFGPFQPPEGEIHQYLLDYLNEKETTLVLKEPIMYIYDATTCTWEFMQKLQRGKVYSFLSELKDEEFLSFSVELKMNARDEVDEAIEQCYLKKYTSIEEGLQEQLDCIKKYERIFRGK